MSRFVQYAGPSEAQVAADPRTMDRIAALPGVAYTSLAAFMLAAPVTADGRLAAPPGQVITFALIRTPPQARAIIVAGRSAVSSRAGEVMINEAAARGLNTRVGSTIHLRGFRPDQLQQSIENTALRPEVTLPAVRVAGIIRTPTDLGEGLDVSADASYTGNGVLYVTAAFYHRFAASVGNQEGLAVHLKRGEAGRASFESEVRRLFGDRAQFQAGSDDSTVAASVQRGTSVQALALLLFGIIVAVTMLVIVGQSIARQVHTGSDDFPALRALGASPGQLFTVAFAPGTLAAAGGMLLAIPVATACRRLRRSGWRARRRFPRALVRRRDPAGRGGRRSAAAGQADCDHGMACDQDQHRYDHDFWREPGFRGGTVDGSCGVPARRGVRRTPGVTTVALAAVMAAVVFGSSLAHVVADPAVAGWTWDLAVGNPHSGDISAQTEHRLRNNPDVAGFTATAMAETQLGGRHVTVVGMQSVLGAVAPPVLAGRLPAAPGEIALGGGELRTLHKRIGDQITARTARGSIALHIVGQVVVSPDITNEQVALGSGGVMTLTGAAALSNEHLPRNVFPVQLRSPADHTAIARLKQQFPGAVLPAVPPPEIRNLQGVSGLPLALALLLTLLATGTIAHTLVTSVRRRRRELAILKTLGFVARQVRAAVAWQATAIAVASLVIGLPFGIAVGRLAWILFANQTAIEPVPVISPLVLLAIPAIIVLAIPAIIVLANAVAAFPARAAVHTQPAIVLRAE